MIAEWNKPGWLPDSLPPRCLVSNGLCFLDGSDTVSLCFLDGLKCFRLVLPKESYQNQKLASAYGHQLRTWLLVSPPGPCCLLLEMGSVQGRGIAAEPWGSDCRRGSGRDLPHRGIIHFSVTWGCSLGMMYPPVWQGPPI